MRFFNYIKTIFGVDQESRHRAWLVDSKPLFSSFGKDIYLSDFVNNAIDRVATEVSKIDIKSVVSKAEMINIQNDDITRLFRFKPNPLQTTSDFLSSIEWLRRKHRNAFIYPQYEKVIFGGKEYRRYINFYPLNPTWISIGQVDGQVWEIKMDFSDGSSYILPYEDLIHLKWRRGANMTIGGGDDNGLANDYDVIRTIDSLDKTIQGLPKGIESSLQIKGVYSTKSLMDKNRREEERDDFEAHILKSSSGIVAVDLAGEFTPIKTDAPEIPDEVMRFLKSVIQERYGISAAILSGDYNSTQHNAFYQTAIEDFIIQMEQAFTACLFTQREQDVGHLIKGYYSKVRYLSTNDKLNMAKLSTDTGLLTLNQVGEIFGFEPFEGGNKRLQSLNYADVEIVNEYQLQKGTDPTTVKEGNTGGNTGGNTDGDNEEE